MTNNLHHRKAGSRQSFQPGFWVSSNSNHEAENFTALWPSNPGEHFARLIYMYIVTGIALEYRDPSDIIMVNK